MDKRQLQIAAVKEENERLRRDMAKNMEAQFIERVMLASLTGASANFKEPRAAAQHALDTANNFMFLLNQGAEEPTETQAAASPSGLVLE